MRFLDKFIIGTSILALFSEDFNFHYIIDIKLLENDPRAKLVDVGCSKGDKTIRFAEKVGTKNILVLVK